MRFRRALAVLATLTLLLTLMPGRAFAQEYGDSGVYWSGSGSGDNLGYICWASSKYDAAIYSLGYNPKSLTGEIREKLSDSRFGGEFYNFAQHFEQPSSYDDSPSYMPVYFLFTWYTMPLTSIYYCDVTQELYDNALADFLAVLGGGGGSGGDGGAGVDVSNIPDVVVLDSAHGSILQTNNWYQASDPNLFHPVSGSIEVRFSNTTQLSATLTNYGCKHLYLVFFPYQQKRNNGGSYYPRLYLIASADTVTASWQTDAEVPHYLTLSLNGSSDIYYSSISFGNYSDVNVNTGVASGYLTNSNLYYLNKYTEPFSGYIKDYHYGTFALDSFNNTVVVDPDGDWPEPDPAPTPPEVPTPDPQNPTTEPDPYVPDPDTPSDPVYVPVVAPDSQDYTDWLRAILSALNNIDAEIVTLAANMGDYFDAISDFLAKIITDMGTHCEHLQTALETENQRLMNYLQRLFTWLGQQFDYTFEGYDDSSVIAWLRRIYNKLGGGTYKPNPQVDEPSFLDWLLDLWHRFLLDLLASLPESLQNLVSDFGELTHYFPFSIPWDLAALLGLFAHAPVAPEFDFPLPYAAGDGGTVLIHVDCSDWNDMAAMIRPCFLAMFCLQLALITRDLLKGLNVGGDS